MAVMGNPAPGGWVSRGYGSGHNGKDYGYYNADPSGSKRVVAAGPGVVSRVDNRAGYNGGWGNRVFISHSDGFETSYNHFWNDGIVVSVGQRVNAGTYLGQMGSTGASSGEHLHFEVWVNGSRQDPDEWLGREIPGTASAEKADVARGQRTANGVVNRRSDHRTGADTLLGDPLQDGDIGNFVRIVRGDEVEGNNLWYQGTSGNYFWSGGFHEGAIATGLEDLTALPAVSSNQRIVGSSGVVGRDKPTTQGSTVLQEFKAGEVLDFKGYVDGEDVWGDGNTAWLVGAYSGAFFHSSRFTDPSVGSLPNLTPVAPPGVNPPVVKPPAVKPQVDQAYKSFKADSPLAIWVGSMNYNWRTPRPAGEQPLCITDHWMAGTLAGTDQQFQKYSELKDGRGDGSASNYAVGQTQIHQYVREQDYQQANGHQESNRWSLSIEHEAGPGAPATDAVIDLAARLKADIALRYGWRGYAVYDGDVDAFRKKSPEDQLKLIRDFNSQNPGIRLVFPHKAWVSTACPGDLPSQKIVLKANDLLSPEQPKPQPDGDGSSVVVDKSWLRKLIEDAQRILGKK